MMQADPLAGGECAHKLAIQPSRVLIINVLDDATFLELGQLQPAGESATFLPGPLAIDEQAEPLFETELAGIGRLDLFPEGVGHAVQLHQLQFFYGGLIQHRRLLKWITAETHWAADRNSAGRECCHGAVRSGRSLCRAAVADRAIASGWISDFGKNRLPAVKLVGWPLPNARPSKSWPG